MSEEQLDIIDKIVMKVIYIFPFISALSIIGVTALLVYILVRCLNHKKEIKKGKALIVGYDSSSSSIKTVFSVRLLDIGDVRTYNLQGVYNVKNLYGTYQKDAPVFKIGDTVDVEYYPFKIGELDGMNVFVDEKSYSNIYNGYVPNTSAGTINTYDEYQIKKLKKQRKVKTIIGIIIMISIPISIQLIADNTLYKDSIIQKRYTSFVYELRDGVYPIEYHFITDSNTYEANEQVNKIIAELFFAMNAKEYTEALSTDTVGWNVYILIRRDDKTIATVKIMNNSIVVVQEDKFTTPVRFDFDEEYIINLIERILENTTEDSIQTPNLDNIYQ